MTNFAQALVLGASLGALYALMAGAVTLVYQASRVPNVAFVGIGAAAAVLHGDLITPGGRLDHVVGWWPAFVIALAAAAVLGVATEVLVRPLQHRPLPALLMMSAWTAVLLAATNALLEPRLLPPVWGGPALAIGDFSVPRSQVAILGLAAACGLAVFVLSRRSRFGLALRASAADPEATRLMGMDPQALSRGAWVVSSLLAAVAMILAVRPVLSNTYETTVYLAFAFGAALLGGFRSLPLAAAGGLALGIVPALLEPTESVARIGGVGSLIAFVLVAGLVFRRPGFFDRRMADDAARGSALGSAGPVWPPPLPASRPLPSWARRAALLALGVALAVAVPVFSSDPALRAWTHGIAVFLMCASIVIVSGWSGEVPLGQVAFAGFGAYMTANLAVRLGLPHVAAIPLAVLAVLPFALVLGLPAVRGRGRLPFTVLSLGLMVVASSLLWGPRASWFTGNGRLARPDWMNVVAGRPAASFYLFALALAGGVVWFAGNLQRSRVGRALAAVRDSEEGAGSLGIDPAHYRLVALTFSAIVAALGGIVYAYLSGAYLSGLIDPARFAAFLSVQYLLYTVVGGAGSLAGTAVVVFAFEVVPALDGQAASSGFGSVLLLGVLAMIVLRVVPGGLAGIARRVAAAVAPAPTPALAGAGAGIGPKQGFLGVPDDLHGLDDGPSSDG